MSHTLLITDDSMIIREIIKDLAIRHGWTVVGEATNGQEAVELYKQLRPAVVTLDLIMPEYDGRHALAGIREFDPLARVLIVSAIDQAEILKETLRLGASDFIVKPFDRGRLMRALELLAGAKQLDRLATA